MRTAIENKRKEEGSILAYFILLVIFLAALASVGAYVSQTTNVAHRRSDMIAAIQYAQGGATVAGMDVAAAYTNQSSTFPGSLANLVTPYILNSTRSTSAQKVYERTISSPFTNQTVAVEVWVTNASAPTTARVVASAKVGDVTQTATLNLQMTFGYGAAILSVNKGTTANGVSKANAQDGNVVVSGGGLGKGGAITLVVDGGNGLAIDANGQINIDTSASVPAGTISKTNWGTGNQIPDYTSQGTANSLFDFNRFIAVADLTTNSFNTNSHNNHFTNVASFANAMRIATNHTLEGVIVVDIKHSDSNWGKAGDNTTFPSGINIHGTLFYNFAPDFTPLDKFVMDADLNINAANLSSLVATNPGSYPTGYPPAYNDPAKSASSINIALLGYPNFMPTDDLPALMYSIGEVDIHGNANVCGVVYTPSYMELENKGPSGSVQYIKGMVITGQGIFYENTQSGNSSIISYDRNTLDNLTTAGTRGKTVSVAYWQ